MKTRKTPFATRTGLASILAGLALTFFSAQASATCLYYVAEPIPTVPDGASASMLEMQIAQYEVQQYVRNTESRLAKCNGESGLRHNATVSRLERVAATFNNELWVFLRDRAVRDTRIDS